MATTKNKKNSVSLFFSNQNTTPTTPHAPPPTRPTPTRPPTP